MRVIEAPSISGTPSAPGNSREARQAVMRALGSIIATGLIPAWRQVSKAENETSSVPRMTGRLNGLSPSRYTRPCRAPVESTPLGFVPPISRAARVFSLTPVATSTRRARIVASPSGDETSICGPGLSEVTETRVLISTPTRSARSTRRAA
jgi:hypothetical protein